MKTIIKLFVIFIIVGFIGTSNNPNIIRLRGMIYTNYLKVEKLYYDYTSSEKEIAKTSSAAAQSQN